ncbi:hypothetical protein Ais01nite_80860 [Asanoa ishikariensis]|uniref:hypothetical protein n=1 Tax=Asanoa ishikariensis TaxID=137265 RepID=UPI0015A3AE67|nr:hypothetical protein [Asanoa ishikariensis]GIF70051.1 hypothetical protein Ais01nite_80860 [Asanoa ishikariensis]
MRGGDTAPNADLLAQRRVVGAFLAASRAGEFEDIIKLRDPDVVFRPTPVRVRYSPRPR